MLIIVVGRTLLSVLFQRTAFTFHPVRVAVAAFIQVFVGTTLVAYLMVFLEALHASLPIDLAKQLGGLLATSEVDRHVIGTGLRQSVFERHSFDRLLEHCKEVRKQ